MSQPPLSEFSGSTAKFDPTNYHFVNLLLQRRYSLLYVLLDFLFLFHLVSGINLLYCRKTKHKTSYLFLLKAVNQRIKKTNWISKTYERMATPQRTSLIETQQLMKSEIEMKVERWKEQNITLQLRQQTQTSLRAFFFLASRSASSCGSCSVFILFRCRRVSSYINK